MQRIKTLAFIFLLLFFGFQKTVFAADIVINEFVVHSSSSDWIELYNISSDSASLDNWKIDDTTSTMVTLSGTIAGNGFRVFEVSNRLNNGGDSLVLKDQADIIIDSYSYVSDPGIDISTGRQPDGTGGWIIFSPATKGSINNTSTPVPTSTPTPSPTSVPTNTPTPTKTPTPTPTTKPTPTPKPPPTKIPTPTPIKSEPTLSSILIASNVKEATGEALPTSILGESTEIAAKITISPPEKETKVIGSNTNNLSKILIGIGVIFIISCGILAFRGYIKSRKENNYSG
jgi:hypothetical protein